MLLHGSGCAIPDTTVRNRTVRRQMRTWNESDIVVVELHRFMAIMRTLIQDIRFGVRVLSAHPGFTIVAILTLALGIASTTTVFSWMDGVLLRPFPGVSDPKSLAVFESIIPSAPNGGTNISWLDFRDYRDQMKTASGLAIFRQCAFTMGDPEDAHLVWGELVSPSYFDVLGVRTRIGRTFNQEERTDAPGKAAVVVISDRLWRARFHADRGLIGKTIHLNRRDMTVIGVIDSAFRGTEPAMVEDLWVPITQGAWLGLIEDDAYRSRSYRNFRSVIRLRPDATIAQARAEAATLASNLQTAYPKTNRGASATVLANWEAHNGVADLLLAPLRILMAVSFVVLLIVCANVANLLLARSLARQREFGIRLALGASRGRLVRQLFTETFMLTCTGAFFALPLLFWMQSSLPSLVPNVGLPVALEYDLNGRILLFTGLACVVAALVSGLAPAMFSARSELNDTLKDGSRSGSPSIASGRTRAALVMAEVALASVALVGAGLFARSFHNASAIHPGFDSSQVLFGRFFIESAAFTPEQIQQFSLRLRQRLEATPGIQGVSFGDFVPLSSTGGPYNALTAEGYVPMQNESPNVNRSIVAPGYFGVMSIPLMEGRDFTAQDDQKAPPVMIVDQAFARRYFRGENPVGRTVRGLGRTMTVVGLAKDSKYFYPAEPAAPHFYLAFRQFYYRSPELYLFVKTAGDPVKAIPTLRRAVMEVDPNAAAFHAVSLTEYTQVALIGQKVAAAMMSALGLISMLLAALGLYSVMSYSVRQRSQEIGIRMAMGAKPSHVIGMVVRQGMLMALAGMALGGVAAFAVSRVVGSMLVNVDSADPLTFLAATGFLGIVAFVATWVPAHRATRIDPISALRRQ